MTLPDTVVIVGASVAGVAAARALRAESYDGAIVMIDGQAAWPYDKPPLSKQLLSGEWDAARVELLSHQQADELGIDVRLGLAVKSLDVAANEVVLADETHVGYDVCVVATGAAARPSPWPARPGIHVLRTLDDAIAIRERFAAGGSVAVVGGGFIGAEVASSARALGLPVTMIDPLESPMERVVGPAAARVFLDLAKRNGVELRLGHGVESIEGVAGDLTITLTSGDTVEAATAVVGIGAIPNDSWLGSSGLLVENGLVCDEFCRARGSENVFAAGDVARWQHPQADGLVRVEHWTNSVDQASCVAHNIVHGDELKPYSPIPYVWTDQHGWKFQIVGSPGAASGHEIVGDITADRPRAAMIYHDADGRLNGALTVNWPRAVADCRRGVAEQSSADAVVRSLGDQLLSSRKAVGKP